MKIMKNKNSDNTLMLIKFLFSFFACFLFISNSETVKQAVSSALQTCTAVIIPSLFPMMIISSVLNKIPIPQFLSKLTQWPLNKLFGLPQNSLSALFTGLTGGYPIGVKNAVQLYQSGTLTLEQAQKFALFCVSPGLAFSIAVVGNTLFHSKEIGLIIFFSNTLAGLTYAFLLNTTKNTKNTKNNNIQFVSPVSFSNILSESIHSSSAAIISMCAWICFFSSLYEVLNIFINNPFLEKIFIIISEVTNAVLYCAENKNIILCVFATSFSGLCITFQLLPELKMLSISIRKFLFSRVICAGFSCIYELILLKIFPITLPTALQYNQVKLYSFSPIGSISLLFLCAVFIFSLANSKNTPKQTAKTGYLHY